MNKKVLVSILIIAVVLLIVTIIAVGINYSNGKEKASTQDSISTRDSVSPTMITGTQGATEETKHHVEYEKYEDEKFENMEEYISNDNEYYKDPKSSKTLKDTVSDADESFEVIVEDDRTLVYKHVLVPMSEEGYSSYLNSLKGYFDSLNAEKLEVLKNIKSNSNIDNPRIVEKYYKNNGTLAIEKEFAYNDLIK